MSRFEKVMRVELKYCEGCGGLQLRPVGSGITFCLSCEATLGEECTFQVPPLKHSRRPRLPNAKRIDLEACADPRYALKTPLRETPTRETQRREARI